MARKLRTKTATGLQPWAAAKKERGMKTRRKFALEQARVTLVV
jgi:hypothetical protein